MTKMTKMTDPTREILTQKMILDLLDEAMAAGNVAQVELCERARDADRYDDFEAVRLVIEAINSARGMDDSRPFVRVVPYSEAAGERAKATAEGLPMPASPIGYFT